MNGRRVKSVDDSKNVHAPSMKLGGVVDIRSIKSEALAIHEPLKTLILSESDSLTIEEYFAKSDLWLKLIREVKQR